MTMIKFETKWGDRLLQGDDRDKIFAVMLKEGIEDGFWYEGANAEAATTALATGQALAFMRSRRDYEYEGYQEVVVEHIL